MSHPDPTDPRPTDPPFLFVMLLAARKAGDRMLESLARAWLAEIGIRVVFANNLDRPPGRQAALGGASSYHRTIDRKAVAGNSPSGSHP